MSVVYHLRSRVSAPSVHDRYIRSGQQSSGGFENGAPVSAM